MTMNDEYSKPEYWMDEAECEWLCPACKWEGKESEAELSTDFPSCPECGQVLEAN